MDKHLLNLSVLADASIDDYALVGFEGREEISQPFEFRLELVCNPPSEPDFTKWIGMLAEWDVYPGAGQKRTFAGRIYGVSRRVDSDIGRVFVTVRPAYWALSYGRATHFIQDKSSTDIFEAMTAEVPGLVKTMSASGAPKRGYAVRYDESEIDFLGRLLAQDGIMYFFVHDAGAGPYRHKMIVTNKTSDYVDDPNNPLEFLAGSMVGHITSLEHRVEAAARAGKQMAFNVNKLDEPFKSDVRAAPSWGGVYAHEYETIGFEALAANGVTSLGKATGQRDEQVADTVHGSTRDASFFAGSRIEVKGEGAVGPRRMVVTKVVHSAYDPWMFGDASTAHYTASFSAIDATSIYRPPVDEPVRKAPGPMLGVIEFDGAATGEIKVDKEFRVPVAIAGARDYSKNGFTKQVWLPVQQQWTHSAQHGAQFFPRIGTRVVIDFLYGNPDLPFITGTVYTPSQVYPFDVMSKVTQSGWRTNTEKNGGIVQEFYFEDKKGAEEIKLYTGRDYRREIDQDDWGTVKRDQTLEVQRNRKRTVEGKETVDVTDTRTVTVTAKNLLESKQEIELKVGTSSIKIDSSSITITATTIKLDAKATLDMKGGATAKLGAPKVDVVADGILTAQGSLVKIN